MKKVNISKFLVALVNIIVNNECQTLPRFSLNIWT